MNFHLLPSPISTVNPLIVIVCIYVKDAPKTEIWGQMRHWWYFNETKSLLFANAGWHLGIVHAVDIEEWSPPGVSLLFWKLTDLLFSHVHNNTKHIFDVCTAHGSVLVALSQWTSSWCDLYDGQDVSAMLCWTAAVVSTAQIVLPVVSTAQILRYHQWHSAAKIINC